MKKICYSITFALLIAQSNVYADWTHLTGGVVGALGGAAYVYLDTTREDIPQTPLEKLQYAIEQKKKRLKNFLIIAGATLAGAFTPCLLQGLQNLSAELNRPRPEPTVEELTAQYQRARNRCKDIKREWRWAQENQRILRYDGMHVASINSDVYSLYHRYNEARRTKHRLNERLAHRRNQAPQAPAPAAQVPAPQVPAPQQQ